MASSSLPVQHSRSSQEILQKQMRVKMRDHLEHVKTKFDQERELVDELLVVKVHISQKLARS